jgi:hypothetical protein
MCNSSLWHNSGYCSKCRSVIAKSAGLRRVNAATIISIGLHVELKIRLKCLRAFLLISSLKSVIIGMDLEIDK